MYASEAIKLYFEENPKAVVTMDELSANIKMPISTTIKWVKRFTSEGLLKRTEATKIKGSGKNAVWKLISRADNEKPLKEGFILYE